MGDVQSLSTDPEVGLPSGLAGGNVRQSIAEAFGKYFGKSVVVSAVSPTSEWGCLGCFVHHDFATKQINVKIPACMGSFCQNCVTTSGDLARLVSRIQREIQHTLGCRQYLHLVSSEAI